ncbi:hypothetical protein [Mycobacterium sp. ST-F2]|uniref:hypothetical protein n=1 Tax=Mycobacterium sp. ST-F2 TaxID=1490484 RepID=UPI00114D9E75|nr:hypothetical protein [Mycobacterium sp. ST-F2]
MGVAKASRTLGLLAAGAGAVAVALLGANPPADTSRAIPPFPAPAVVPNVDGSLSPPGMPGDV